MKKIILILQFILLLGCAENDMGDTSQIGGNEKIMFQVTVKDPITKSFITDEATMDSLGFFGYRYDRKMTWPADYAATEQIMYNSLMTYSGHDNKLWDYADQPYYWGSGASSKRFTFFGIAPFSAYNYGDDDNNNGKLDWDEFADLDPQTLSIDPLQGPILSYNTMSQPTTDLMVANLDNIFPPFGGIVTLNFEHALSALSFKTDDYTNIREVELNCYDLYVGGKVTVNSQPTWKLSDKQPTQTFILYDGDSKSSTECMILPQAIAAGDLEIHILHSDNSTPEVFKIPANTYEVGKHYTFKIKSSYFVVEEDALVVDLKDYDDWCVTHPNNSGDYDPIDKAMAKIKQQAADNGTDVTLKVINDISPKANSWNLLEHILGYEGVQHYDFSEMGSNGKTIPNVFGGDKVLKSIKLPVLTANSQLISGVFKDCTSLETIEFAEGSTITKLSDGMCRGCTSLKKINLTTLANLSTITRGLFERCSGLTTVTIPKSVKAVEGGSFLNCTSLNNVIFESGSELQTIANQAFGGCSALRKINIPASTNSFEWGVFNGCTALTNYDQETGYGIYFEGDNPKSDIKGLSNGLSGSGVDVSKL